MDYNNKPYLSVEEAISLLGIGRSHLYRIMRRGDLPVAKIGCRTIIRREDLDDYVRSQVA